MVRRICAFGSAVDSEQSCVRLNMSQWRKLQARASQLLHRPKERAVGSPRNLANTSFWDVQVRGLANSLAVSIANRLLKRDLSLTAGLGTRRPPFISHSLVTGLKFTGRLSLRTRVLLTLPLTAAAIVFVASRTPHHARLVLALLFIVAAVKQLYDLNGCLR